MFDAIKGLMRRWGQDRGSAHRLRRWRRAVIQVEALEPRWCPAGTWVWTDGAADDLWSNPAGGDWKYNGMPAPQSNYPGMAGSIGDVVQFSVNTAGSATVDVQVGRLAALEITAWGQTLTLNFGLTVAGSNGDFLLNDNSVINMANNSKLILLDLGGPGSNEWSKGDITGGTNNAVLVTGSELDLRDFPANLETNLSVQKSVPTDNNGIVNLSGMDKNLTLSGPDNIIDVGNGGFLELYQSINANGLQNTEGGIDFGADHTGPHAVQVETGGTLYRGGIATPGVPNQVSIAGTVYNLGGKVSVTEMNMLKIVGKDANGYSYWQQAPTSSLLSVSWSANISAVGTYQIDAGTVSFTTNDSSSSDELDGAGLIFGNANATSLIIGDKNINKQGIIIIQGPVTLAPNTTTTMNYAPGGALCDTLDVHNGNLTLNGTLTLHNIDYQDPPFPVSLDCFYVSNNMSIVGGFATIQDDWGDTGTGQVVRNDPFYEYYQVIME